MAWVAAAGAQAANLAAEERPVSLVSALLEEQASGVDMGESDGDGMLKTSERGNKLDAQAALKSKKAHGHEQKAKELESKLGERSPIINECSAIGSLFRRTHLPVFRM